MATLAAILPAFLDSTRPVTEATVPRPSAGPTATASPTFEAVFSDLARTDSTAESRTARSEPPEARETRDETAQPVPNSLVLPTTTPLPPPVPTVTAEPLAEPTTPTPPTPATVTTPERSNPNAPPPAAVVAQPPLLVVAGGVTPESSATPIETDAPGPVVATPASPTVPSGAGRSVDLSGLIARANELQGNSSPRIAADAGPGESTTFRAELERTIPVGPSPLPVTAPTANPATASAVGEFRVAVDWPPGQTFHLADAVATHAGTAKAHGSTEFVIRLDPPSLGRVDVKLVSTGDELRAFMVVASDEVRRAIEAQWPMLRDRLDAAGVTVSGFDVRTDSSGQKAPADDGAERSDSNRPARVVTAWAGPVESRAEPGRLDVTA